jgi:SAM-dependent methyltransferase
MKVFGQWFRSWAQMWRRIEGPELEPAIWHSHYLVVRAYESRLKALGAQLRGEVIDIGAGTGHGMRYLDKGLATYFPTDIPGGREPGDASITAEGIPPVFNCSAYDIPFPEGHFGGAMMLSVLEHLEYPAKALGQVLRVLKPGAFMLISTPFAFPFHGVPHDYRRWTADGLASELRAAGFEIVDSEARGATFSSLTVNLHLAIRYQLQLNGPKWVRFLISLLLPIVLLMQAIMNLFAIVLDRLDRSPAFPMVILVLARKPIED